MARRIDLIRSQGFSLVELLVALVFTMLLMAGMATVFKSSLTTFYTSGESISSARRNRMSMDLLYDDLNSAGMALANFASWDDTQFSAGNPPFYILPNQPIANASPTGPATTDELYLFYDAPLAFEGSLISGGGAGGQGLVAAEAVESGVAMNAGSTDSHYVIECNDPTYASSVQPGMRFHIKDDMSQAPLTISGVTVAGTNHTQVAIDTVTTLSLQSAVSGRGDAGTLRNFKRFATSPVVFFLPLQMVRYRIEMRDLDPSNSTGVPTVPCLVRSQANYDPAGFPGGAAVQSNIVAENVADLKIYLSANSGQAWVGGSNPSTGTALSGYAGFGGWTSIRTDLDAQLAASGRAGFQTTQGNEHWFRDIPTLVRFDLTTRTATQREEYSTVAGATAFKRLTQSLVIVPRHFGLTMN